MARDDRAEVAHRHTTSDIRGGRFPEGMLPSGIIPAIETAQGSAEAALAEAASKSQVVFSDLAASGTDFSNGDTWYQRIAGIIIAQWEFTGGAWAARTLDGAVVANLDASKITTGTLSAGTTITAGDAEGSRIELDSAGLRKYATDGTTVQVDLTGEVAAFSGLITGSEIIAGATGAARIELDSTGLRVYAADGVTVLLNTVDAAMIRARVGANTALGADTQVALTTGTGDTAVGAVAQQSLTSGHSNTAVGSSVQKTLTTGFYDTAVGTNAQYGLTSGARNTAVGSLAQQALTIGTDNTAVGSLAQKMLTTGLTNAAVGSNAQQQLTTGNLNTAVGPDAQFRPLGIQANATTTGSHQTSIGPETGQSSATQVGGITTIGYRATAGANNATSIGREARADHAGSIALGYQALTTQVDQVMVGPRDVEITDTTKGLVLVSPDTTRMRITVADDGSVLVNGAPISAGVAGAWAAFAPAWTATGTNPALGNGTLTGRYSQVGKTVSYEILLLAGSTTTFGSGIYVFSLPVDRKNSAWGAVGSAYATTGGTRWAGIVSGVGWTTVTANFGSAEMSPTVPGTFASGNRLSLTGMYEAA